MSKIEIQISGISAELVLGSYMPKDATIFHNWEDFFNFNDLIHTSQLLSNHVSEIQIMKDDELIYKGLIPSSQFKVQKIVTPALIDKALYLRTECAELAVYKAVFEAENFDKMKLEFFTQSYDLLFKVGQSFITKMIYDDTEIETEWVSGKPVGNICVLCRFENGYLLPIYDAVNKVSQQVV